jgi:hypothetical protein
MGEPLAVRRSDFVGEDRQPLSGGGVASIGVVASSTECLWAVLGTAPCCFPVGLAISPVLSVEGQHSPTGIVRQIKKIHTVDWFRRD